MNYHSIQPFNEKLVQVIIETPKGASLKYTYDAEMDAFTIKKALPMGMVFPLDFGFIPNTLAQDGDPLDALVLMEGPAYPGCIAGCRIIGILEANQKEGLQDAIRNDRLLCVLDTSRQYADIKTLEDIDNSILKGIKDFFITYNTLYDKTFTPLGWKGADIALAAVNKHSTS